MTDTPIIVTTSDVGKDQAAAALRQILLAIIPLTTAAGMTQTTGVLTFLLGSVGVVATIVVFVWGQIKTRLTSQKLATAAAAAPNSVAQLVQK